MQSAICCLMLLSGLPVWNFDQPDALKSWEPNGHFAQVALQDGHLHAEAIDWDPFFSCGGLSIPATPWQYLVVRLRAGRPGTGDLFWSNTTEGQYSGLAPEKRTPFAVRGTGDWEDIVITPFWHSEGTIVQLRLDLYEGTKFDLASIQILDWAADRTPTQNTYRFEADTPSFDAWQVHPALAARFAPPLDLAVDTRKWVTVELRATASVEGRLLWAAPALAGVQSEAFDIEGDGIWRHYNVSLAKNPAWTDRVLALGLELPVGTEVRALDIADAPQGPARIRAKYAGFENGVNRAERTVNLLALFENSGGTPGPVADPVLTLPGGLTLESGPLLDTATPIGFGEQCNVRWSLRAQTVGSYDVRISWQGGEPLTATLSFLPALPVAPADYVPAPRPVHTAQEVLAYYFPGWDENKDFDCVRMVAPIRKPLLGYYQEGHPECVDWQIKWAVENGITGFLVDWYWVQGNQQLTHWFEAYRKAQYRDQLKVAIMWANHNPPKTHSRDDWRMVTQEWIDRYFNLPAYYTIDGKPAVYLWNPDGLREDLGSSEEAAAALAESQEMARAAGYPGIAFVTVNGSNAPSDIKRLTAEGYAGVTNYHEWGKAVEMGENPRRARFAGVVQTAPARWEEKEAMCGTLTYYPLVDTGWDARPWHGGKSLVLDGRTTDHFEALCRAAKAFSEQHGNRAIVLGPLNEWGEGSYIEPNTEFGFDMYEVIRRVFATDPPDTWPANIAPADVARSPYDYAVPPR
ncbi:MAG: glycoside hydrolase family 99-like domain-containing protein [Candidatus Hydrogenedentes bacterium]|nr:glycoside hydrolase family 99-like domain-containing protein [Candidatus Hydrogenedentota bacterium]